MASSEHLLIGLFLPSFLSFILPSFLCFFQIYLGVVVYAFNSSAQEAGTGESIRVRG